MMANQTDGIPTTPLPGLEENTAAAFYGFAVGAILFGVTIRQAFQYWTSEGKDPWSRRAIIAAVCLLDTLDFGFGLHMVYSFLLQVSGMADASKSVLWSLKALGTAQTFLIVLVQGFYLSQIWRFSGNRLLSTCIQRALKVFVVVISLYAFAIAVVFLMELAKIKVILSFTAGFEYIVYLGLGSTALIDCLIAATMCVMLYKSGGVTDRGQSVIETLITYFVGTGLLTSLAAILGIVMYVAKPGTLIYLAVELSVTRLYAIAMLALFNTRHSLQRRFELTAHTPSEVKFTDPSDLFTSPSPGRREFLLLRKSNFDTSSTGRRHAHRHLPSDADSHIISLLPSPDSASLSPSKDPFASPLDKVHGRDRYSALPSGGPEGEHKYIPYRGYASGKGGHVRVDSSADGTMSPDEDEFLDDDHKDEDENDPFRSPVLRRDGSIASRQYTV